MDLSDMPIVDNHCHSLLRSPVREQRSFRLAFAEANDAEFASFVPAMAYYQAALLELAGELGVPPDEDAVLTTRAARDHHSWCAHLLRAARLDALLVDDGVPPAALSFTRDDLAALAGCPVGHIWRLETAAQHLIQAHAHFNDFVTAWDDGLRNLRERGIVALKSIAAYRTGLNIAPADELGARAAFAALREAAAGGGSVRLADKGLLEFLLHRALAAASGQEVPIQFHTGYGDPDTDLRLGNPLHLRAILDDSRYAGAPIILLHESYPYTREAAWLAAVYPHVYADLSYAIPNIGWTELLSMTRAMLAVAPWSKLLYSSDGHSIPEHVWLGARRGREILATTVEELVGNRELLPSQAEATAAAILGGNARRVYRLDRMLPHPGP